MNTVAVALRGEGDFLDAFKRLGCYLEDCRRCPSTTSTSTRGNRRVSGALRALTASSPSRAGSGRARRGWWRTVVLGMVKTGDIAETLRIAGVADLERADLPFPVRHPGALHHRAEGSCAQLAPAPHPLASVAAAR
jgi:hypothetical protein